MPDNTHYVVEAVEMLRVQLFSEDALGDEVVVICDDAFDSNDGSPNPPDTVTIATATGVVRGEILAHAYVVKAKT